MGLYTLITLLLLVGIIVLGVRTRKLRKTQVHLLHQFDETSLILESLNDGLIECDREMLVVRINHAAETMLGTEANRIVNRPIDTSTTQNATEKLLTQILYPPKGNASTTHDVLLPEPDGRKLRVYSIAKTDPKTKALSGYIKIVRDVSIETVVEAHKNDLVSIVSHQLLTPLTGIKWILKSLLDGDAGLLSDKQSEYVRRGMSAGDQTIDLVTDILDVTKVEQARFAYKKEPADIVAIVQGAVASRREKAEIRNIHIESELVLPSKTFAFDRERVTIALANIIDNAIDYSPTGSTVQVRVAEEGGNVVISVRDHGIGIPSKEGERLFSKFYRTENAKRVRTGGTGLGLYLAKHIAEAHGGSITYVSSENGGSTFALTLPTTAIASLPIHGEASTTAGQSAFI